ncbi:hypothetical protein FRB90_002783 [Tulasnella sp. 427]|nr:hypothetical protein FRB90_002783 [Tulasnella sp. 427]
MEIEYYQSERQASRNDTILDLLSPSISHHENRPIELAKYIELVQASDNNLSALKALHIATDRFAATIPAVLGPTKRDEEDPDSDPPSIAVLMARTITLGALLEMNNTTAATDTQAYNARLTSAGYIASLVFYLGPENFANADMATGYCWCLAAQVLLEHMHSIRTRLQTAQEPPPVSSSVPVMQSSNDEMSNSLIECESQLTRLLAALEKLSTVFPTLGKPSFYMRGGCA